MHQRLKESEDKISAISRYCPTDLFSGDAGCLNFALDALLEDPQNNFKVFVDGVPQFHDRAPELGLPLLRNGYFKEMRGDNGERDLLKRMIIEVLTRSVRWLIRNHALYL